MWRLARWKLCRAKTTVFNLRKFEHEHLDHVTTKETIAQNPDRRAAGAPDNYSSSNFLCVLSYIWNQTHHHRAVDPDRSWGHISSKNLSFLSRSMSQMQKIIAHRSSSTPNTINCILALNFPRTYSNNALQTTTTLLHVIVAHRNAFTRDRTSFTIGMTTRATQNTMTHDQSTYRCTMCELSQIALLLC